ncbi:MAG: molybdenum ABC transporter ATP-binding protein [Azospirillaceae bacterium]
MLSWDVEKRFGDFALVAKGTVAAGGVHAVFGPSGSGKSTLLNLLAGLLKGERQSIRLGQRWLADSGRRLHLPPEARALGLIFQDGRLFPHLSVRRNLTYGARMRRLAPAATPFDEVAGLLGLAPLLERRPGDLSGGERQRVAIGRALLSGAAALLLDEPLASLDQPRRAEVLPYLDRLRATNDMPMVYVTHAVDEVLRLADTITVLDQGKAVAEGGVAEVLNAPATRRFVPGLAEETVIDAQVREIDRVNGLVRARAGAMALALMGSGLALGSTVRLRLAARDIAVATEPPRNTSVVNILPGVLTALERDTEGRVHLDLDLGLPVRAIITASSAARLALAPGQPIHAMIKAIAVDRVRA